MTDKIQCLITEWVILSPVQSPGELLFTTNYGIICLLVSYHAALFPY